MKKNSLILSVITQFILVGLFTRESQAFSTWNQVNLPKDNGETPQNTGHQRGAVSFDDYFFSRSDGEQEERARKRGYHKRPRFIY